MLGCFCFFLLKCKEQPGTACLLVFSFHEPGEFCSVELQLSLTSHWEKTFQTSQFCNWAVVPLSCFQHFLTALTQPQKWELQVPASAVMSPPSLNNWGSPAIWSPAAETLPHSCWVAGSRFDKTLQGWLLEALCWQVPAWFVGAVGRQTGLATPGPCQATLAKIGSVWAVPSSTALGILQKGLWPFVEERKEI